MRRRWLGWWVAQGGELPLWLLPSIAVPTALIVGLLLGTIEVPNGGVLDAVTFRGGVAEARQMLAVIAGTMITVTGLVFVLTVVALQLASTQFSPRLLKSFLADLGTQIVLATFVATFAFAISGLHTVGRVAEDGAVFVPRLAISGAMVLALVSVGMLVFYIQHVTNSIRIDTIMLHSARDTLAAIERQHPAAAAAAEIMTPPPPSQEWIPASCSGYLQGVDIAALLAATQRTDVVVVVTLMRGQHVLAGSPAGYVVDGEGRGAGPPVVASLSAAVDVQPERNVRNDAGFGIRQLVDIATRAMSTGNNDPYTAVQAVHHLTVLLNVLCTRPLGWQVHRDADGAPRVFIPVPTFAEYLGMVCGDVRPHATRSLRLIAELLHLLARMGGAVVTERDQEAVASQIARVVDAAERAVFDPDDMAWILSRAETARASLSGSPAAHWPA